MAGPPSGVLAMPPALGSSRWRGSFSDSGFGFWDGVQGYIGFKFWGLGLHRV